ncbi:MAG TPA: PAS domain S-box protein, partial [Rudaea sp.]|nr:PAS domain S-box protein [Rudaea sp.]
MNLASAFRFSSSLVAVLDAGDGRIVDVNPAFEHELGYGREAMLGRSTLDIDFWPHPQTRASIWALLRSERRVCGERVVFRNLAGSEFAANLYCEFFEHEGRRLVLSVFQRLAPADAGDAPADADPGSYHALFMASAEGLYRSLPDGGWIDVNPALASIFGYASPAQMLKETHDRRASDIYADAGVGADLIERIRTAGHFEKQRARVLRRDGSTVWISESSRGVRDAEGHLLFYEGSIIDIGAQVEAEARLRQSENMYRTLVDSSRDGVFLIHHDGTIGFINEAMAQTLGYRAEELIGTSYLKLIAPEALAEQMIRRNERAGGSYAVQTYDTVMIQKDGTRRLLHVHAGAVDYEGEVASTGTARDVTEEHRQRQALEWAERTYRELFQNAVSGMFRSQVDGRIVAANDAFAHILGYADAAELLESGRGIGDFYANPD